MTVNYQSERIVLQRIRNRIIEYFDWVSSFEEQTKYQQAVPLVSVPYEVINQWEDWVIGDWKEMFISPVFSELERQAISSYYTIWEHTSKITPHPLPALSELITFSEWESLRKAALEALQIFKMRGKLSEENEDA